MKPLLLLLAAALSAGTLLTSGCRRSDTASPATSEPPSVYKTLAPTTAPAWELQDLDGKAVRAEDFKGKVLVVDFWATWCAPCVHEIPGFIELQKKYGAQGLQIVGISLDETEPARVKEFSGRKGINYPIVRGDTAVVSAFGGVQSIPTTFIIDRDGNIRFEKIGSADQADTERVLKKLL